jgi:hypothetical protein
VDPVIKHLLIYWTGFGISNILLGASIMMLVKGTLPPPMTHKKANPVLSTSILVVGLTMMLVFGTPALLQETIEFMTQ